MSSWKILIFLQGSSQSVYKNKYTFFQSCHTQKNDTHSNLISKGLHHIFLVHLSCK